MIAALAMGTIATAATIVPAMAAAHPAAVHAAAHAKRAVRHAKAASDPSTVIGSELDNGEYVTVVRCHGVRVPPPITVGKPGTPLTAKGVGPSAGILKLLKKPSPYKTIYTCTVVVETKTPTPKKVFKKVRVETGFGGMAGQVRRHHPAG